MTIDERQCPVCGDLYLVPFLSDVIKYSSDGSQNTASTTYTKIKEKTVPAYALSGKLRIKFTLATNDASYTAYGRIYKDGIAVGTERTTTSETGEEFSEDIEFGPSTKVQIYLHGSDDRLAIVTNFRIYCSARCLSCGYDDSMLIKHNW